MPAQLSDCDVLVVGAGPAGCAAAITAARASLAVGLIESQPFPRVRPGETLHPGVEPLLESLGVLPRVHAAGFPRHSGHWVQWPDGPPHFEAYGRDSHGPWRGFQAWRATFDAILLEEAIASGTHVLQPCRALCPLIDNDRVSGVRTSRGDVRAAVVIDAAGGTHWLARHLKLRLQRASPRLFVRFGYLQGRWPERDEAPMLHIDEEGWLWSARVRADTYAWARLAFSGSLPSEPTLEQLAGHQRHGLTLYRSPGAPARQGMEVTWRLLSPAAGPGYFLVGDAARVIDPAGSHGILHAIASGMRAGWGAGAVIRHSRQREAEAYAEWVANWFAHDVSQMRLNYQKVQANLPPEQP